MAHPPFNLTHLRGCYASMLTIHSYARRTCNVCDAAFIIAGIQYVNIIFPSSIGCFIKNQLTALLYVNQ